MTPPWRPIWLLAAPHRLAFFMAALMLVMSSIWWGIILVTRALGTALFWAVPVSAAHGLLMTMGFMPLFFAGFLFTAGPKWLRLQEVTARSLLPGLIFMLTGWVLVLIGFHTYALVSCAGMTLVAAGWTVLSVKFSTMVQRSDVPDRIHARLVAIACGVGSIAFVDGGGAAGHQFGVNTSNRHTDGVMGIHCDHIRSAISPHDSILRCQRSSAFRCMAADVVAVGNGHCAVAGGRV